MAANRNASTRRPGPGSMSGTPLWRSVLTPPIIAPPPLQAGIQANRQHHEEHHDYVERHDSVVDTYESTANIPVTEEFDSHVGCFDGPCYDYNAGMAPLPPQGPCGNCGYLPPQAPCGNCGYIPPQPPCGNCGVQPSPLYYGAPPAIVVNPPATAWYYRRGPTPMPAPMLYRATPRRGGPFSRW